MDGVEKAMLKTSPAAHGSKELGPEETCGQQGGSSEGSSGGSSGGAGCGGAGGGSGGHDVAGAAGGNEFLVEQLAQRQAVFSQIGNFVAAMQHETGSAEVWRAKLKELEELRQEKRALKHDLGSTQQQLARATEKLSKASAHKHEHKREGERLAAALSASLGKVAAAEHDSCSLRDKVAALEAETVRVGAEAATAAMLAETNHELNAQLARMKVRQTNIVFLSL